MTRASRATCALALLAAACASPSGDPDPGWDRAGVDRFFDSMVDRHLEAGYEDPVLNEADPLLEQRLIVITATINERTAKDAMARLLYLSKRDPSEPIDLVLSTQGGWLDATFALVDVIDLVRAPVNVWGVGGIYSAGSLVLANGSGRRVAARNAIVMVHANLVQPDGPLAALGLERFERLWRRRANLPESWFPMTSDAAYYLSPEEALEYGIIDEIADGPEIPAPGPRRD